MNRRRFLQTAGALAVSAKLFRDLPELAPGPIVHAGDTQLLDTFGVAFRAGDHITVNGRDVYTITHVSGDGREGCITLDRPLHATGRIARLVHHRAGRDAMHRRIA